MNVMTQQVLLGVALLCGLNGSCAESEAPSEPVEFRKIIITPLALGNVTRVLCIDGSGTGHVLPTEPVCRIIARTLARGVLQGQTIFEQHDAEAERFLFLFEGDDRSCDCRMRDDLKALEYTTDAMLRWHRGAKPRDTDVLGRVMITYKMSDADHAQMMRLIRTARRSEPYQGSVDDSLGKPDSPRPIEITPLFPQDSVTKAHYTRVRSRRALPVEPISSLVAQAVKHGEFHGRPFRGSIFAWIVLDTPDREFTYQFFESPRILEYRVNGVMIRFQIRESDHAQIIDAIEAARPGGDTG